MKSCGWGKRNWLGKNYSILCSICWSDENNCAGENYIALS